MKGRKHDGQLTSTSSRLSSFQFKWPASKCQIYTVNRSQISTIIVKDSMYLRYRQSEALTAESVSNLFWQLINGAHRRRVAYSQIRSKGHIVPHGSNHPCLYSGLRTLAIRSWLWQASIRLPLHAEPYISGQTQVPIYIQPNIHSINLGSYCQ